MKEILKRYLNCKSIRFTLANDKSQFHLIEIFESDNYEYGQVLSAVFDDCIEINGVFYHGGKIEKKYIPLNQLVITIL